VLKGTHHFDERPQIHRMKWWQALDFRPNWTDYVENLYTKLHSSCTLVNWHYSNSVDNVITALSTYP